MPRAREYPRFSTDFALWRLDRHLSANDVHIALCNRLTSSLHSKSNQYTSSCYILSKRRSLLSISSRNASPSVGLQPRPRWHWLAINDYTWFIHSLSLIGHSTVHRCFTLRALCNIASKKQSMIELRENPHTPTPSVDAGSTCPVVPIYPAGSSEKVGSRLWGGCCSIRFF